MSKELIEAIALAIGRVVTRGEVEPRKGWLAAGAAALSAIEREGFKVVPVEPTNRMLFILDEAVNGDPGHNEPVDRESDRAKLAIEYWTATLDAAARQS